MVGVERVARVANGVANQVVDALLTVPCAGCERPGWVVCDRCAAAIEPAPPPPLVPGVDRLASVIACEGVGRNVVARLKYRRRRHVAAWIAPAMAQLAVGWGAELVTFVPTTAARRRARGLDHAAVLAAEVAGALRLPAGTLLSRPGHDRAQTGRSASERRSAGPGFLATARCDHHVLLVDDVVTTGATLEAAARVLTEAGAAAVTAVTAAATP